MKYDYFTQKKKLLDQYRPLPKALVRNLDEWFRIELTYTSNAIEGNTLTRQETALIVEKGLTVGGKTLIEHLEATNHAHAIDWVKMQINRKPKDLSEKDILRIHDIILKGIDDENAGHYRRVAVRISGSTVVLPNPRKVPDLMSEFINYLKQADLHPVELAAEAHYRLVTIHPFSDGNGRTARLLMNIILMMNGYPMAIIRKSDRLAYISALEKAQLGGSKQDYFNLISKAVDRSLEIYLKAVEGETDEESVEGKLLKIGELAKQVGETNATIRYWTQQNLLIVAEVTDSGYQLYSPEMIARIKKIQLLKKERYTLQEIKEKL
ncbi:MAG: cell filamentation protein Fic [Coxiella sp. RIFCSPHIGHO2_12_FULL_44_14]|nr:MAG: cell filamentation protein Fic [Coxiella sp. RIFCSPHIGHO2_12_FULL_44_14]